MGNGADCPGMQKKHRSEGKYKGITCLSHMLKLLERILDGGIRAVVDGEIGEEQQKQEEK